MLAVIMPARDEVHRIGISLRQALSLPAELIVPVINGCLDHTWERVLAVPDARVYPLLFRSPLGLDVPRAAGAFAAYTQGASAMLFVDADWITDLREPLRALLAAVTTGGVDLALTACPEDAPVPGTADRSALNRLVGRADLAAAGPSYGPMAISGRFAEAVPLADLGVPPVAFVKALKAGLRVEAAVQIPHGALIGAPKGPDHPRRLADTIKGDCLEARRVWADQPRSRSEQGTVYLGYHSARRLDLYLSPDFPPSQVEEIWDEQPNAT